MYAVQYSSQYHLCANILKYTTEVYIMLVSNYVPKISIEVQIVLNSTLWYFVNPLVAPDRSFAILIVFVPVYYYESIFQSVTSECVQNKDSNLIISIDLNWFYQGEWMRQEI